MNLNEFKKEVHGNAIAHGWWEGERDITETIALIHSEWSEALEEYRADRPMVWTECEAPLEIGATCPSMAQKGFCTHEECNMFDASYKHPKPEGIAVELIDGCIRILDLFGRHELILLSNTVDRLITRIHLNNPTLTKDTPLPTLVCALHSVTARAVDRTFILPIPRAIAPLESAMGLVFFWLKENGFNPEKLMRMKHEYNKTRPYKHGKKC